MAVRYSIVSQQLPFNRTDGTGTTNVTAAVSNPDIGPVGVLLREFGIPYSEPLGGAITFILSLSVLYMLGQIIFVPFAKRLLSRQGLDPHERQPIVHLTKLIGGIIGLGIAFQVAGYGQLLASLSGITVAATLAIGLALEDTIANFVAGMFIYIDRPFRIGDWIEWEAGTYVGFVEDVTFRVTHVRTFDNELLTVPNTTLTQQTIKNPVEGGELRLHYTFNIDYEANIEQATDIILEEATAHPGILDDPAPTVRMSTDRAPTGSSVGLTAFFWITDPNRADFLAIQGDLITNIKQRFDDADITIPYPQIELSGDISTVAAADRHQANTSPADQ